MLVTVGISAEEFDIEGNRVAAMEVSGLESPDKDDRIVADAMLEGDVFSLGVVDRELRLFYKEEFIFIPSGPESSLIFMPPFFDFTEIGYEYRVPRPATVFGMELT